MKQENQKQGTGRHKTEIVNRKYTQKTLLYTVSNNSRKQIKYKLLRKLIRLKHGKIYLVVLDSLSSFLADLLLSSFALVF